METSPSLNLGRRTPLSPLTDRPSSTSSKAVIIRRTSRNALALRAISTLCRLRSPNTPRHSGRQRTLCRSRRCTFHRSLRRSLAYAGATRWRWDMDKSNRRKLIVDNKSSHCDRKLLPRNMERREDRTTGGMSIWSKVDSSSKKVIHVSGPCVSLTRQPSSMRGPPRRLTS